MNMHSRPWFRVLRPGVVGALVLVALQPVAQALTVYTAGPAGLIKELAQGFEQQGGEKVEVFQADSGKVMARVESEAGNPRVDVLISASWDSALDLHQRGWLLNYRSPNAKTVPAAYQGSSYVAQGLSALAIAWNPSSGTPRPTDWKDLAEPAFQGKVNMPDPSKSGTALELISGLQSQHGAQAWKLFGELRANGMHIAGANAQALNPVLQGAKAAVFGAVDYVTYAAQAKGEKVEIIFPRSGTVVAARPMMIFKRSPKAEQAKRFVDYVLSDEGQRIVAKSYLLPARSDVPALRPALGSFQAWPPESDAQRAGRAALLQRFDELFVRK
jgi:iron(III) transport system substrate-binding protein